MGSKWVKRPGIVTFVVDSSGSMMGDKIKQAREGLSRALDSMAWNNQVGLVIFDDTINTTIPVGPLADNRFTMVDAPLTRCGPGVRRPSTVPSEPVSR